MSLPIARPHTKWSVALALGIIGSLLVGLLVLAFVWPTKTAQAQNLPVGIAGPDAVVDVVGETLDENAPGTFDLVGADDRADAVDQIQTRQTYGAIVFSADTGLPEVLIASAAGSAPAQMLQGVATQLQAQAAAQVAVAGGDASSVAIEVTDVVPLSEDDANGSGLVSAVFPLSLGGIIGGLLVSIAVAGVLRRLVALGGFAVASGIVLVLIMQTWFGFLQGEFWLNVLAMGLAVGATSSLIVGCASLLGRAGIPIGALLTMLIGNPLSAAAVPWQFLAEPWGVIGQYLVPGAAATLLRSLSYFPDADTAAQWWALAGWTAVGVVLAVAGHFRSQATVHMPEETLEHEEMGERPVVADAVIPGSR